MSDKEKRELYENAKSNSIGNEKKATNRRINKKMIVGAILVAISIVGEAIFWLKTSPLINSNLAEKHNKIPKPATQETTVETSDYGMDDVTISNEETQKILYEFDLAAVNQESKEAADNILSKHGMTEYTMDENGKRIYKYKEDDFKQIEGLNENYIVGFYGLACIDSVNEMVKALGYENFDSYVKARGYVTDDDEPNIGEWRIYALAEFANHSNNQIVRK